MAAAATSIVDEVDRLTEERGLLKQRAIAFDETAQRCLDTLWTFLDGVYGASVTVGAAG